MWLLDSITPTTSSFTYAVINETAAIGGSVKVARCHNTRIHRPTSSIHSALVHPFNIASNSSEMEECALKVPHSFLETLSEPAQINSFFYSSSGLAGTCIQFMTFTCANKQKCV